jgi:uncharacterized RDD family membrane protein YckC
MRAWRIRVVAQQPNFSSPISLTQALLRCVLGTLGLMAAGAGYWCRWFNADGDTWHDQMTATRVVVVAKTSAHKQMN